AGNSRSAAAACTRPIPGGSKIRLVPDDCYELIPIQQRGAKCPPPDRQETRKPGVRDSSLIGPRAVFETFFRQEFLVSTVRFGRGTDVPQYLAGAGTVLGRAGEFIVLQHAIGEFDVERRPAGTPLVGRSCNPVDHLVLRIIRRYQEVKRIRDSKPGLAKYQIRRGCEQRAFAGLAQIPKPLVHVDEIERDARRRRFAPAIQVMPDIAMLAEQTEQFLLVLRELAPEQPFQLDRIDHPEPDA